MGIVLKVTETQLVAMADNISSQITEIEKQFLQIENEISRSKAYWEGDASDAHQKKYADLKEGIAAVIKNMKRHPENLLEMAEIYRESEANAKTAAMSLPTDVII